MNVIKRNGSEVPFDRQRIVNAVTKANQEMVLECDKLTDEDIVNLSLDVTDKISELNRAVTVEEIQDIVESELIHLDMAKLAKAYITYRYKRELVRKANTTDEQILSLINLNNEEIRQENSNKNPTVNSVQRDYMAGEVSKDLAKRFLLPEDVIAAHERGELHFHDMDYYSQRMHNCCLINLEDMLQNGTVISKTLIEKPHSFSTACNITTQIIAQVASNQYGGQTITLSHLAPFVDISRQRIVSQVKDELYGTDVPKETVDDIVNSRLKEEIKRGVQMLQYQIITLMTTNGQAPFVTLFMCLSEVEEPVRSDLALIIEEVLKQRIQGVKNEKGQWITPAFPKLIYALDDDNMNPNSVYYPLTVLAAECTAKRMVPDYISADKMMELKGDIYPCMGCRSFLTPDRFTDNGVKNLANAGNYVEGEHRYYGRFNQGVVTVNLVDIGLSADKDLDRFWKIFDERMDLCHKALRLRHEHLVGTPSDVAPILWQYGAIARLQKGEVVDKLLYDGYSTISLGYAGLWECVYSLIGKKLTEPEGEQLGLEIMTKLNDYTAKWKADENIDYSIYGTPLESTTYKFSKCLQKKFGIVEGVTDKNYITNSYHVHVTENIDAFSKLELEAKFQALSPGGAISYVEVPNMQNNIPAVLEVMHFIKDNIMYAELNTKSDYCQVCGYNGEIEIVTDKNGKLIWKCPNCENTDQTKMNVARRTCGYIGTEYWNQGRTQEIKERVLHL